MLSALPEEAECCHTGSHLGERSRNCGSGSIQPEHCHQNNIQHNIDDRRHQDKDQRPFGLTHPAQNAADCIIAKDERIPDRRNDHIGFCLKHGLFRAVEHLQNRVAEQDRHCRQND